MGNEQMKSLVNFDGIADVANNLIDKISNAIGWVATHDTPTRIAVDTYIQDLQNSNLDPLMKAALISQAKRSIKEYCNQQNVVRVAMQTLKPTAKPEVIDDDWIAQFMDKARMVSDVEFQILWGNILAEECNEPGSVPKALLHIMEQMDKDMATMFMSIASVSVSFCDEGKVEYSPMIYGKSVDDYYMDLGITLDGLVDLQSVGLIETSFGLLSEDYGIECHCLPVIIQYFDEQYELRNGVKVFNTGNVIYTKAGQALCRAVTANKIHGFFAERCIPWWERVEEKE